MKGCFQNTILILKKIVKGTNNRKSCSTTAGLQQTPNEKKKGSQNFSRRTQFVVKMESAKFIILPGIIIRNHK